MNKFHTYSELAVAFDAGELPEFFTAGWLKAAYNAFAYGCPHLYVFKDTEEAKGHKTGPLNGGYAIVGGFPYKEGQ